MSVVMTCMLTVPHENQLYTAQRPKQSMAKYEHEPPDFDLVLSLNLCDPEGSDVEVCM